MEKKLYRSQDKKVIAGIAGGLGEYLDIDPIIIRIIIVLITIFHGIGLLIYIIMWIVIPAKPYKQNVKENYSEDKSNLDETVKEKPDQSPGNLDIEPKSSNGRIVVGALLILIGTIFLFDRFIPFFDFEFVFAIGLVILGMAMIFNFFNKSEKSS